MTEKRCKGCGMELKKGQDYKDGFCAGCYAPLQNVCIGVDRIREPEEKNTMQWLLRNNMCSSKSNIDSIKSMILCIDKYHPNYEHLTDKEKKLVDKLILNEDVVDITLITLFRWFGSHVGQNTLNQLQEVTKK